MGPKLRDLFVGYVRALDETNLVSAFLKLWAILEDSTGTGEEASRKTTVRRAVSLLKDEEYHRLMLDHLRTLRSLKEC